MYQYHVLYIVYDKHVRENNWHRLFLYLEVYHDACSRYKGPENGERGNRHGQALGRFDSA